MDRELLYDEKYLNEKIKQYFEEGEFENLPDLLKERHRNVYRNYIEMEEWGLEPELPDFISNFKKEEENKTLKKKGMRRNKAKDVEKNDRPSETISRPKRNILVKSYKEDDVPALDHFIYCDNCKKEFENFCPTCGALSHLEDNPVELDVADRAKKTVPKGYLIVRESPIHGLGVFAKKEIPARTQMGPYVGLLSRKQNDKGYSWMLKGGKTVDGKDPNKSNWMRYVNCARHVKEQNVVAFQYKGQMYYRTVKNIKVGEEMLVYYGEEFANNLGINTDNYFKPNEEVVIEGVFPCPHCPLAHIFKNMRDRHELFCKSNPRNLYTEFEGIYTCAHCQITLSSKAYLDSHEKYCGERKKGQDKIEKVRDRKGHSMQYKYLKEKRYACEYCDYRTRYRSDLKKHNQIHTGNKRFICSYCKKGHAEKKSLKIHMYRHTNMEKPYKCEQCDYQTAHSGSLKQHIAVHTKDKKFMCDFENCNFSCNQKSSLKTHSYIHLNLKPFKCLHCNYACRGSANLKRHISRKHKSRLSKEDQIFVK